MSCQGIKERWLLPWFDALIPHSCRRRTEGTGDRIPGGSGHMPGKATTSATYSDYQCREWPSHFLPRPLVSVCTEGLLGE